MLQIIQINQNFLEKQLLVIYIKIGKKPKRFKEDRMKPIWESESFIGNANEL